MCVKKITLARHRRQEMGLTIEQLAFELGWGLMSLSRVERGEQTPRPDRAEALADYLGIPRDAVVFPHDHMVCQEVNPEPE